jgi:uncharacterized protein YciI
VLYSIIGQDIPNSLELRKAHRPAHVARLETLQNEGRLILAGPFPAADTSDPGAAGFVGSLIVAEFASFSDAQAWAAADPYMTGGVFSQIVVQPFKKTFPS